MKALVIIVGALAVAHAAEASPCGEKIAALQARFSASPAAADPAIAGTETESVDAKLHHQPTAGSVATAEASADSEAARRSAHFQIEIEQAQAADDSGDARSCEEAVVEAQKALPP
jgi:hypothetical protein